MDLPSGFNVENWETEGNFGIPVNEEVSLALTEDATSKRVPDLPQVEVAAPSVQSSTLQEQQHYALEASINIPLAEDFAAADKVLVENQLKVPLAEDKVEIYEQKVVEQREIILPQQQSEICNIPLPLETDFPPEPIRKADITEGSNQAVTNTTHIENSQAPFTENLNGLPFSQETSTVQVIDEAVATPDSTIPVQECVLTTSNEAEQQITREFILPDHNDDAETETYVNTFSEAVVVKPPRLVEAEMTKVETREPEELLADLNSSDGTVETQSLEESAIERDNSDADAPRVSEASASNGKSVIDLVLPVVDSSSVTLTDPVSLRPVKPTATNRKPAEDTEPVEDDATETYYTLPAHVIGRPSGNPAEEQKLRPGIKSPMGHLRSQILSRTELAQELQERTQKNSAYKYPEKGDIFFAKTLTKRLASHINVKEVSQPAADAKLAPLPPTLSAFKESKAKKTAAQPAPKPEPRTGKQDDTDLLAILEGEVDDWTIDRPPPQLIEAASSPVNVQTHPPKLDPSVEREMALQQLSNMPTRPKKPATGVRPPPKKMPRKSAAAAKPRPPLEEGELDPAGRPLRKRKADAPVAAAIKKAVPVPHSNGAAAVVKDVAPAEADAKEPRIFKTKRRAGTLTNGTTPSAAEPSTSKAAGAETKPRPSAAEADVPALVTRELISPPRTYSSRIKKSTFSDDFVFPSTSKSRVVPIVGGAGKEKPGKKAAKAAVSKAEAPVVEPPAPAAPPAKKPAPKPTPKKAKSVESVAEEPPKTPAVRKTPKKTPKKLSEIDRLLMDEGAINMLYSVEQNEEKRRSGGGDEPVAKKRLVKTTRHFHKELLMKTRLVKSAVQRLRNTPDSSVALRTKRAAAGPSRKPSSDSAPAEPSSPPPFGYPPQLRTPAEASRIIRRHSSSSNYSSRSGSPTNPRRPSVDVADETAPAAARETRKRGGVFITKLAAAGGGKKKRVAARTASVEDAIFQPTVRIEEMLTPGVKAKLQGQMAKNFQKAGKSEGKAPDLTACLAEAVTAFIAEDGNVDSSNVPPGLSSDTCLPAPLSPSAGFSYSSLIKALEADCQRRAGAIDEPAGKERTSPRQPGTALTGYKELSIRRHDNMVQIILAPVSTKMLDSLNPQVLKELQDVLTQLQNDDACRAVLVTSTGSAFCLGVDFHSLMIERAERRRATAQQFAQAVKRFMTSLSQFTKPIIAGVHGAAVGLGVTMLPFFDMVFASDKATFYTPYARLGQVPEGAAVVALPQLLGNAVTSELLYACRKLTASEALQYGLVTRILWPDRFHEELLPLINTLAAQSAQSMEATKALLRYNLRARVDAALESEERLLAEHWASAECQAAFKRFLDDEDVGLRRQRGADV